jgi:hypothetical protein
MLGMGLKGFKRLCDTLMGGTVAIFWVVEVFSRDWEVWFLFSRVWVLREMDRRIFQISANQHS